MTEEVAQGTQNEALFVDSMRRCREIQGLSQGDLANRLVRAGWHAFRQTTVSRIEKRERTVRLAEAHAIAQCLGVSLSDMLSEDLDTGDAERLRNLDEEIRHLTEELSVLTAQWVQLHAKLQQRGAEREALARSMESGTPVPYSDDVIDLMGVLTQTLTRSQPTSAAARYNPGGLDSVVEGRDDG